MVFAFSNGIEVTLARQLEARGVLVEGDRVPDSNPGHWEDDEDEEEQESPAMTDQAGPSLRTLHCETDMETINLDVSTMVAYVSSLTNGESQFVFQQRLLTQQAEWERAKPLKSQLEQLFQGRVYRYFRVN